MIYKLHTSKQTMDIFKSLGKSQGLQPFALAKISIALSLRTGKLSHNDLTTDNDGLELNRQTILGEHELLFKALIAMNTNSDISDSEFFPTLIKAHLDRGAVLLQNESRYGMHFYKNLLLLDDNL